MKEDNEVGAGLQEALYWRMDMVMSEWVSVSVCVCVCVSVCVLGVDNNDISDIE